MELLTDPAFAAVAVVGVCLLGVSKGGFFGLGIAIELIRSSVRELW